MNNAHIHIRLHVHMHMHVTEKLQTTRKSQRRISSPISDAEPMQSEALIGVWIAPAFNHKRCELWPALRFCFQHPFEQLLPFPTVLCAVLVEPVPSPSHSKVRFAIVDLSFFLFKKRILLAQPVFASVALAADASLSASLRRFSITL